jgi:hypothetical protein
MPLSGFAIMAIALNSLCPLAMALNMAVRSAQLPGEYAAFSTLTPVKVLPSVVNIAEATAK